MALAFAHGYRFGRAWIWKLFGVAFPLWKHVLFLRILGFTWAQWVVWGVGHIELLSIFAAVLLYGFRCDALWAGGLPGPGWARARRRTPGPTPVATARSA